MVGDEVSGVQRVRVSVWGLTAVSFEWVDAM